MALLGTGLFNSWLAKISKDQSISPVFAILIQFLALCRYLLFLPVEIATLPCSRDLGVAGLEFAGELDW